MLWCHGAQNIGLSNHKLKSAAKCTVWFECTTIPNRETDDGRTSWQERDDSFYQTHRALKTTSNSIWCSKARCFNLMKTVRQIARFSLSSDLCGEDLDLALTWWL